MVGAGSAVLLAQLEAPAHPYPHMHLTSYMTLTVAGACVAEASDIKDLRYPGLEWGKGGREAVPDSGH